MSVRVPSTLQRTLDVSNRRARNVAMLSVAILGVAAASACSSSTPSDSGNGDNGSSTSSSGSGGNGSSSSSSGSGNSSGSNSSSSGNSGGSSSSGSGAGSSSSGSGGGNSSSSGSGNGSSSGSNGGSSSGSSSGGAKDAGADGTVVVGDGGGGCTNTDMSTINLDSSGFVCNNKFGIQGAWYCYSDGSDTTNSCQGSNGKGMGAIPWNASSKGMCLSGTMGTGTGSFAGIGFKLNSGPPASTAAFGAYDASKLVGFAVTLAPGASGKGSGGMVLNVEYPSGDTGGATGDEDPMTLDAPGVTVPGVAGMPITYNVLFSDSVLANNKLHAFSVDPKTLTDLKIAFFPDSVSHSYDFCITNIVPLMTAPSPVVATGNYGPAWTNQQPQAVNGVNGYAVQSAPFPMNGNPMTMQVKATSGGVGFTYNAGGGFQAPNSGPGSFPAIISGWGPGHDGIQFYGPYKGGKSISSLKSVMTTWSFTMGSTGDAVYDVWFSNAAQQPPTVPGIELMVWIGNTGKNALGSMANPGTAVMGRTPFVGTNGTGESVVSYWVPQNTSTGVSNFDLLPYFQDAASHGYAGLSNSSVLLGVQTGFEVYAGNWATSDYNINIQ